MKGIQRHVGRARTERPVWRVPPPRSLLSRFQERQHGSLQWSSCRRGERGPRGGALGSGGVCAPVPGKNLASASGASRSMAMHILPTQVRTCAPSLKPQWGPTLSPNGPGAERPVSLNVKDRSRVEGQGSALSVDVNEVTGPDQSRACDLRSLPALVLVSSAGERCRQLPSANVTVTVVPPRARFRVILRPPRALPRPAGAVCVSAPERASYRQAMDGPRSLK
ncbi:hypothetical protein AAFF_G00215800 [Aldrovandia affinis]|uniref:Uncharacterized protein n=1 Tax=Aldrovandia affinis TaxID=143900 RepID=A0AAD7RG83_9TELE|nr:hypothetical protein AAFF_G00215800 [Aldrovandia affinis]